MPKKAKGGPRDSVFTVRLPARLRFGLELTARLNNEPMTDVVVRALSDGLSSENGGLFVELPGEELPVFLLPKVWDERESVRLVKLALVYPSLLGATERRAWEVIRATDKYWSLPKVRSSKATKPVRKLEDLQVTPLEADWEVLAADAENARAHVYA
jgi:hypothetical protein